MDFINEYEQYIIPEELTTISEDVIAQIKDTPNGLYDILFNHYPLSTYRYCIANNSDSTLADSLLLRHSTKYFPNDYAYFVYLRSYARMINNRLECWPETIYRYISFMRSNLQDKLSNSDYQQLYYAMLNMEILPSMRLIQFSGETVQRNNIAAYNCCYVAPACIKDLVDIMYVLMCGTGVGFSVRDNINNLPIVQPATDTIISYKIPDTKEGWCDSWHQLLIALYDGQDISFDYSLIRPEGTPLVVTGGTAPGPDPLRRLHEFSRTIFISATGRKLTTLEVHDLLCMVGQIVLVGGARRSAMISLSDVADNKLATAKSGEWYIDHSIRSQANNSAVYTTTPDMFTFLQEWNNLVQSRCGERGIFSLSHMEQQLPARRVQFYKEQQVDLTQLGTNPCGEIFLRSHQFCNLSSVICAHDDTIDDLLHKVRLATMLGTYQATLTNFKYVSSAFTTNCEAERLLGVSLSGQMGCPLTQDSIVLHKLKQHAISINNYYAEKFNIAPATAITCVKPDGTTGAITGKPSGLHCMKAEYYWRRVRHLAKAPLSLFLKGQGVDVEPCALEHKSLMEAKTWVFKFPIAAPPHCTIVTNVTAIEQCNNWLRCKLAWCEHNPSVTIDVKDHEWLQVGQWVYEHWAHIGGMSFCPYLDCTTSVYPQLPFEEISKEEYINAIQHFPHINYAALLQYSVEHTNAKEVMACTAGSCMYA